MRDPPAASDPVQHVYRGQGSQADLPLCCAAPDANLARVPTIADLVPVTEIMTRSVICARRDLETGPIVDLIVRNRIGSIPVVEEPGRPVGMVTKLDLVEQLLAPAARDPQHRGPTPETANDLMMPIAITLGEHATVAHAAALMAGEDVHHIPIVDDEGRLIGVVSTMDVVRWLAKNDGFGAIDRSSK